MATTIVGYPESPMDSDDVVYPCKGCGEILEEGKAFELAGHRWHLECFKCNTCGTILDSDANLLLLGDGSLICNNCTYSCSACGNKIQDLAILTGDQAYCAGCFRCRNCKKKIENLRYARTSQGMFCMECHDALMARRRKKTKHAAQRLKQQNSNHMLLDKSLPSLPPTAVMESSFSPDSDKQMSSPPTPTELPGSDVLMQQRQFQSHAEASGQQLFSHELEVMPQELDGGAAVQELPGERSWADKNADSLGVPGGRRPDRNSGMSEDAADGFFIPMALDPSIVSTPPVETPVSTPPVSSSHGDTPKAADKENTPPGGMSDYLNHKESNHTRKPAQDMRKDVLQRRDSGASSQATSPRTSYKEGGPKKSDTKLDILSAVQPRRSGSRSRDPSPLNPRSDSRAEDRDRFKLQEPPAARNQAGSAKDKILAGSSKVASSSEDGQYRKPSLSQQTVSPASEASSSGMGRTSTDNKRASGSNQLASLPKRGDSLISTKQSIQRKEVGSRQASKTESRPDQASQPSGVDSPSSSYATSPNANTTNANGGMVISKPMESPVAKSFMDYPQRSDKRPSVAGAAGDSFSSPREAPQRPPHRRGQSASIGNVHTPELPVDISPKAVRTTSASDVSTTDERQAENDEGQASFLKRVSNSVRHARSHSDRAVRNSRDAKSGAWPKTPNGTTVPELLTAASPSIGSPESQAGIEWYRNTLRQTQKELADREEEIHKLKDTMNGKSTIKQMNTELREKRSTMVVLDTQKEIVVRELEVLTDHIAESKRSGEPLDISRLQNGVLRDFAESLQRLKDSFAPQIEELMENKTAILQEIQDVTLKRDRVMTEFETLSIKNAQLTEMNNNIIQNTQQQVQNAQAAAAAQFNQPQGLGISGPFNQQPPRSQDSYPPSVGSSTMRGPSHESHATGTTFVSDLNHEEPVVMAPKVVDVRKGQVKKFNWKKGGIVAKSVGKGLKDAFSSDRNQQYEHHQYNGVPPPGHLEGTPYGSMQAGAYPSTTLPKDYKVGDNGERPNAFGLFGQQRGRGQPQGPNQSQQGRATPVSGDQVQPPAVLYGSELQARAAFEGVEIPNIIVRCIQEVQSRGMDVEGIYRKSGGSGQIQEVKEGLSRDTNYDLSDNDLDIHAVTSALKQYFRKLPTPLITYAVYDRLIVTAPAQPHQPKMGGGAANGNFNSTTNTTVVDQNGHSAGEPVTFEERIEKTKAAIATLPKAHRATLEFLIFHLAKITTYEKVNLMTAMNCAVVFAPTIMRPMDIVKEMTDTGPKTDVVRFMIVNCEKIFLEQ